MFDFTQLTTNAQFTDQRIFVQNMLKMGQVQKIRTILSNIRIFLVYFISAPLIQLGNTENLGEDLEKKTYVTNGNNCRLICGQRSVRHVILHVLYMS